MRRALLIALLGALVATGGANAKLRPAFPQTHHPSREAVFGHHDRLAFPVKNRFVTVPGMGTALFDRTTLHFGKSRPGARPNTPFATIYQGSFLPYFRYSGAGFVGSQLPSSNGISIALTSATLSNVDNHVAAWQGITDRTMCNNSPCNWMQAGIQKGYACFGSGSPTTQHLFFEVNYNGSVSDGACPNVGAGYIWSDLGGIPWGTSYTVILYFCQSPSGCSYSMQPCDPHGVLTSSYKRGALFINGCARAANIYLGGVNAPRSWVGLLEDGYPNAVGDSGAATFRSSTNPFNGVFTPNGCFSYVDGFHKGWNGCLN